MIRARTKSEADTRSLAGAVAGIAEARDLIVLSGSMGAGKTAFAKGFGQALGVTEPITSPTFVLIRSYEGSLVLHHVDIYRLENLQEVIDLGLMELLDEGGVALVEWGQLAEPILPRDYLELRINTDDSDDDVRHYEFVTIGSGWESRQPRIRAAVADWLVES